MIATPTNQTVLDRAADILEYDEVSGPPLTMAQLIEAATLLLYDEDPWTGDVPPTATSAKMEFAYRLVQRDEVVCLYTLSAWAEERSPAEIIALLRGAEVPAA